MSDKKKSFEEALAELEEIVRQLEKDEIPLEQALEAFEKGVRLSKYCAKCLDEAEQRIQKLTQADEGELKMEPWEEENAGL